MNLCTFCKKDGNIKKNYIPICEYLIQTKIKKHKLTRFRSDDIVKEYCCYTTPYKWFTITKEKENFLIKIREICNYFNVTIQTEWIYPDVSIEFKKQNVQNMIDTIKRMLGGGIYT